RGPRRVHGDDLDREVCYLDAHRHDARGEEDVQPLHGPLELEGRVGQPGAALGVVVAHRLPVVEDYQLAFLGGDAAHEALDGEATLQGEGAFGPRYQDAAPRPR